MADAEETGPLHSYTFVIEQRLRVRYVLQSYSRFTDADLAAQSVDALHSAGFDPEVLDSDYRYEVGSLSEGDKPRRRG